MSDLGETFRAFKEIKKEEGKIKKERNLVNATKLLDEKMIPYEVKNSGIHYVVDGRFDYYPTTGKFIDRKSKKQGRGIFNLMRLLNEPNN